MQAIGRARTPYGSKFGAPKQSGLARSDRSQIELDKSFSMDAIRGLREQSFIWVVWLFHENEGKSKEVVRPPRLGGNEKLGVFATRSPFRPNNIGLSLVKFESAKEKNGRVVLAISGADMMDGTPVLDIKPYHSQGDAPWGPTSPSWYEEREKPLLKVAIEDSLQLEPDLRRLIQETLALDPRPAYHKDTDRVYINTLWDWDVYWRAKGADCLEVVKVKRLTSKHIKNEGSDDLE